MSAISPALRNLRRELNDETAAFSVESAAGADAAVDLIESELAAAGRDSAAVAPRTSAPTAAVERSERASLTEKPSEPPRVFEPTSNLREFNVSSPRIEAFSPTEKTEKRTFASDLVVVSGLKKGYVKGKKLIPVLQGVNLTARQGELLALVGQSGSGKSTLLHLMGALDVPDAGTIHFDGQRIDNLPTAQRDVLRNHFIGMIFQFYHLIPEMTTLENVLAPLMIRDSIFGYLRNRTKYVEK
ncbi:MAG: ATP-binding cassette domain-containing protein, partial [Thermoguttaceae bacterium]|nr:ATP-binding cassette domain-containing protein [Thermoguttaceae bacterium]